MGSLPVRVRRVLATWVLLSAGLVAVLAVVAGVHAGGLDITAMPWQQFFYGLAFMPVISLGLLLPLAYVIDRGRRLATRRRSPRDIRER